MAAHRATIRENIDIEISWIINSSNRRLAATLESYNLRYVALDLEPTFRWLRNPFALFRKTLRTRRVLHQFRPDLLVLVQGWIMDGIDGLLAASLARVPFCSYIPMTHSPTELGIHRSHRLRTVVQSMVYRRIPRYITFEEEQAARLRKWRPGCEVAVVENVIPGKIETVTRAPDAKQKFGIPADFKVLGVHGRISFRQKAQDWLVRAMSTGDFLQDKFLLFVGEGPDTEQLTQLIETSLWRKHILFLGWVDNLRDFYNAVDVMLLPSRAEGVPLVMIEALARQIPVVGSDRDGMKTWLPRPWRFAFGDVEGMRRAIIQALTPDAGRYWDPILGHLAVATDESRLGREFGKALKQYCAKSRIQAGR